MKLLLINPKFPESFWSFKWAIDNFVPGKRALNPPLGLATLAALCPDSWDVEIVDENIHTVPLHPDADIIGVCGMAVQFERQKELLHFYRRAGYYVVAGGSYASLCPEAFETLADATIAGEAEYIWPEFCRDFESGRSRRLYQETGVVSLADSPVPRFDLLDLGSYRTVSLQFSRGCPFRCEFCDIIVMFGRKPRTKPIELVARELDELRKHNVRPVFFVDDNLIGNKPRAKELLRFLRDYQKKHNYWFEFGTEASLNLAQDDEMLRLFREANFGWVFVGIESTDEESLLETGKTQNTKQDILASVRKVYSYGIEVLAGFIIGFDNDTVRTFDEQYAFIMDSGIQSAMIGLLTAIPKTPLYDRLKKENRLIDVSTADNSKLRTNVIPKRMTYDEMIDGYRSLHYRLFSDRAIAKRIKNKGRYLNKPVHEISYSPSELRELLPRFFIRGLLAGGLSRIFHFLRSMPLRRPQLAPLVITEWIIALSMRSYMDRHFVREYQEDSRNVRRYVESIRAALRQRRHKGTLGVSFEEVRNAAAAVSFIMKGWQERDSFRSVARHADYLLRNTRSTVILHIEEFHDTQLDNMKRLLQRLAKHGDRIHILMDEKSRSIISIDSSVFNLVLSPIKA